MRKLRLDVDELVVESFDTDEAMRALGTVHGQIGTARCNTADNTCDGERTCYGYNTCGDDYTCGWRSCGACGTYYCGTGESCDGSVCIDSCAYTCPPCEVSVNEVGTCIAPCTA